MKIIGITGTIGAGKGTVVDYLVRREGFEHFSVRAYLNEILQGEGIPANRDTLTALANELRKNHHPAYIVEQLFYQAKHSGKNCIIESIRTPGEVELLRSKGFFFLIAIDADPELRYQRIKKRKSETDMIDYPTFLENEKREMKNSDPNKQNIKSCIDMADLRLKNNAGMDALYEQLHDNMQKIIKT